SPRQRAAPRLRVVRTSICKGVRGLARLPPIRLTCPKGLFIETFRPRLPDCGMSNIFILNLLSFVDLFVVVKWRAWPSRPTNLRAPKVSSSLACAFVHAGEARLGRIDGGGQPFKGGEQFPVVGIELFQDGQVVGVEALPGRQHLRPELRLAHQLGLAGWFGTQEP